MDRELIVLYDNQASRGLEGAWGFSCLITPDILFDTGGGADMLRRNADALGVDLGRVRKLVVSHDHGDHSGGLDVLGEMGEVEVYLLPSFSGRLRRWIGSFPQAVVREVNGPTEIAPGVMTNGGLGRSPREQSLLIMGAGITVITGCAHPGMAEILSDASRWGRVTGLVGGFHDFSDLGLLRGLDLVVPCHCTKAKTAILETFPQAVRCGVGLRLSLEENNID
ncbi:MAG: MBL fold metallo-hydrolase [Methanomassiliicoccales archaeon]